MGRAGLQHQSSMMTFEWAGYSAPFAGCAPFQCESGPSVRDLTYSIGGLHDRCAGTTSRVCSIPAGSDRSLASDHFTTGNFRLPQITGRCTRVTIGDDTDMQ